VANALALFGPAWEGLLPREQANVLQMLLESVVYDGTTKGVELSLRPTGIAALATDMASVLSPAKHAPLRGSSKETP